MLNKKRLPTLLKWILIIAGVGAVAVGLFAVLYFNIPVVHDWFINLFKPETTETADAVIAQTKNFINF